MTNQAPKRRPRSQRVRDELEETLDAQFEYGAKTAWTAWVFTLGAFVFGLTWAWFGIENFAAGKPGDGWICIGATGICFLVAYGMWQAQQVQDRLAKKRRDEDRRADTPED